MLGVAAPHPPAPAQRQAPGAAARAPRRPPSAASAAAAGRTAAPSRRHRRPAAKPAPTGHAARPASAAARQAAAPPAEAAPRSPPSPRGTRGAPRADARRLRRRHRSMLGTAVQAAAELAEIGLTRAPGRSATPLARLPRPSRRRADADQLRRERRVTYTAAPSSRAIVRPRAVGGGTTCGTHGRRGESVPLWTVAPHSASPSAHPVGPTEPTGPIQRDRVARIRMMPSPRCSRSAAAPRSRGARSGGVRRRRACRARADRRAALAAPAPSTPQPGNIAVTASGDGITLQTRASALLRNSLHFTGTAPARTPARRRDRALGHETGWAWAATVHAHGRHRTARSRRLARRTTSASSRSGRCSQRAATAAATRALGRLAGGHDHRVPAVARDHVRPRLLGPATACGQILHSTHVGVANRTLPCGTQVALYYRGRTLDRARDRPRPVRERRRLGPHRGDRPGARGRRRTARSAPCRCRPGRRRDTPAATAARLSAPRRTRHGRDRRRRGELAPRRPRSGSTRGARRPRSEHATPTAAHRAARRATPGLGAPPLAITPAPSACAPSAARAARDHPRSAHRLASTQEVASGARSRRHRLRERRPNARRASLGGLDGQHRSASSSSTSSSDSCRSVGRRATATPQRSLGAASRLRRDWRAATLAAALDRPPAIAASPTSSASLLRRRHSAPPAAPLSARSAAPSTTAAQPRRRAPLGVGPKSAPRAGRSPQARSSARLAAAHDRRSPSGRRPAPTPVVRSRRLGGEDRPRHAARAAALLEQPRASQPFASCSVGASSRRPARRRPVGAVAGAAEPALAAHRRL